MSLSLEQINALNADDFVIVFGGIYEHSPWVARQAAAARPFASVDEMLAVMQSAVGAAAHDIELALIRAHPELKGRPAADLTADSRAEHKSVGLDQCSPQELEQLESLNRAYLQKFGFPFVIAVRGLTRAQIMDSLSSRLGNDYAVEFDTCLAQIDRIAGLRLAALTQ